jgi:glycosyltransferase involved in cell wall biosynthesis
MMLLDGRFLRHSGIGRHITGVVDHWPGPRCTIMLSDPHHAPTGWDTVTSTAAMYSLSEQGFSLRRLAAQADAIWFPHYAHPWRCAGRWVCTVHDVIHLAHPELFPGRMRRLAAYALLKDVRDCATGICFVSRFTQQEFHRLVGKPSGAETIVGNGVTMRPMVPPPPPRDWNGRPYVIAIGNAKPHKGLTYLLRAMLSTRLHELDLVLIGHHDGMRTVDRAAQDLSRDLGTRCRWTGFLSDADLQAWLSHARMLAFPSIYEGFGLPPLEAMASGIPVVASRIPSVVEVCGAAAYLAEPGDIDSLSTGIERLHRDTALRCRLVDAGRRQAATWSWKNTAEATWSTLQLACPDRR